MTEAIKEIFTSGQIWAIVIKVLLTTAASGLVAICGTALGKMISKNKESKIYKYAETLVEAAEQKFPNEGTKMGPQKMEYVMSQIVIRFPSVRDNQYLYNIAEQAVYKLNEEKQKEKAIKEFEDKYGEGSYVEIQEENKKETIKEEQPETKQEEAKPSEQKVNKLRSF